ncbi:hypothetical protein LSTR_LSTR011046 [Laodelphax striatellus]|uniref:Proline-rich transmembrane protein 3/4 domain-containing protein n=1 Tax=Laodelphax striatellus TaxID=195883 RepID=A0A482WGD8_LAOST|nr:hypothetical protein LSTR_LSTR011046 [Laodelphax striatellus]
MRCRLKSTHSISSSEKMLFLQTVVIMVLTTASRIVADVEDSLSSSTVLDRRLGMLDSETSDIFNKTLASKHGSSAKNLDLLGTRNARTPATVPVPRTTGSPVQAQTSPSLREIPSYAPPSKSFFTPPLPPEFHNPFANKPTLRGSNSDGIIGHRRPIPPPPPPRLPPEAELIPIRPPDVAHQDTRKKTLNTPSFKKVVEVPFSETSSSTTTNSRSVNETFDFVPPILPYTSISRILSGGSGRKHDSLQDTIDRARFDPESKVSRTIKQEVVKSLIPPTTKAPPETAVEKKPPQPPDNSVEEEPAAPPSLDAAVQPTTTQENIEELTIRKHQEMVETRMESEPSQREVPEISQLPESPEPRTRQVLGVAWDVHVYLMATLFAILAICSMLNIIRISSFKRLLTRGYFLTLHGFLLVIGSVRSIYLFYDAYNINRTLPEPVSAMLLDIVFPLLTSSFAILFLFLLLAGEVKLVDHRLQRVSVLSILIILHLSLTVSVDLFSGETKYATLLPLLCQCLFVILCVILGLSYLYLYKSLSHSSLRKQGNIFGSVFSDCHRSTLAHAVRVTLATSLLSLLMAGVQLYGMFWVYEVLGEEPPHPWLWWGYQFSVRVIEISMCFLMSWAGVQPLRCDDEKQTQNHCLAGGFGRGVPCGANGSRHDSATVDDIYPAICSSNQAIHNYSLRTGKQVYDDAFPVGLHGGSHLFVHNTTDRRSFKKQHPAEDELLCGGTLVARRLQPSPSMLVAENGFVRFRSLADAERPGAAADESYVPASLSHPREDFT